MFHDINLPLKLAFGSRGGPSWRTEIARLASGREVRSSPHSAGRRQYDVGASIRTLDDMAELISFFNARRGAQHSFAFRDPLDHKSCAPSENIAATDQLIGTGDGTNRVFQLTKSYGDASDVHLRSVSLPVVDSVVIAVNGETVSASTARLGGQVTLDAAPPDGALVTAGFEYDVPVRFVGEHLAVSLEGFQAGEIVNVPLIEVAAAEALSDA